MFDFESDLYLEAHITIDPVFNDKLDLVKRLAGMQGFKVAHLLMQKREKDTPEVSKYDTFITGHGKHFIDMQDRTKALVRALIQNDIRVRRYKIEDTILDSRHNDVFSLI